MAADRNDVCPGGGGERDPECRPASSPQISRESPIDDDREWFERRITQGRDVLFYGRLAEDLEAIPLAEMWREFRRLAEIYTTDGGGRTRNFHRRVDELIDSLVERDRRFGYAAPFCHKGCCNCCHELVYCTAEEAQDIHEYAQGHALAIDYGKLSRQLEYVEFDSRLDHTGRTSWNEQAPDDRSCVFLNPADGGCQVWPVRPFVCRAHLAEGSSDYCAPHNGVENPNARGINYIELSYILSVVFTVHSDTIKKTMGRLLLALR